MDDRDRLVATPFSLGPLHRDSTPTTPAGGAPTTLNGYNSNNMNGEDVSPYLGSHSHVQGRDRESPGGQRYLPPGLLHSPPRGGAGTYNNTTGTNAGTNTNTNTNINPAHPSPPGASSKSNRFAAASGSSNTTTGTATAASASASAASSSPGILKMRPSSPKGNININGNGNKMRKMSPVVGGGGGVVVARHSGPGSADIKSGGVPGSPSGVKMLNGLERERELGSPSKLGLVDGL